MARKHGDKPETAAEVPSEVLAATQRILNSEYSRSLAPLVTFVRGKVVVGSTAGTSGFALRFTDGTWAASYLDGAGLAYAVGEGGPPGPLSDLLNSPEFGDASDPLRLDRPYSGERCDIVAEVAKCHGQRVTGLAQGEDCFNFCFPDGMELDTHLVHDREGRLSLRVFWEQW